MLFGRIALTGIKAGRSPARPFFEIALIREAYRQTMPILAICRGIQKR
jgi:gamma-glutamyl-gamma-aminobutyrate hydrolase PuuD